ADIPVILVTVVDRKDLGRRLGAADHLVKPFERADLLAAIDRVAPACRPDRVLPAAGEESPA
ncbi:MAG: hypothetical protein LDL44_07875, partial [Caenispirillum sp.]|nr:hypothetical protein [Caenispirillum sp.]